MFLRIASNCALPLFAYMAPAIWGPRGTAVLLTGSKLLSLDQNSQAKEITHLPRPRLSGGQTVGNKMIKCGWFACVWLFLPTNTSVRPCSLVNSPNFPPSSCAYASPTTPRVVVSNVATHVWLLCKGEPLLAKGKISENQECPPLPPENSSAIATGDVSVLVPCHLMDVHGNLMRQQWHEMQQWKLWEEDGQSRFLAVKSLSWTREWPSTTILMIYGRALTRTGLSCRSADGDHKIVEISYCGLSVHLTPNVFHLKCILSGWTTWWLGYWWVLKLWRRGGGFKRLGVC